MRGTQLANRPRKTTDGASRKYHFEYVCEEVVLRMSWMLCVARVTGCGLAVGFMEGCVDEK